MERIILSSSWEKTLVPISLKSYFLGFSRRQRTSLVATSWAVALATVLAAVVTVANLVVTVA